MEGRDVLQGGAEHSFQMLVYKSFVQDAFAGGFSLRAGPIAPVDGFLSAHGPKLFRAWTERRVDPAAMDRRRTRHLLSGITSL